MGDYRVEFERIGPDRDVPPLTLQAASMDELAKQVLAHGRRHLGTRWHEVWLNQDGTGGFSSGLRDAGRFSWQPAPAGGA
jgi:hypothetical protein